MLCMCAQIDSSDAAAAVWAAGSQEPCVLVLTRMVLRNCHDLAGLALASRVLTGATTPSMGQEDGKTYTQLSLCSLLAEMYSWT